MRGSGSLVAVALVALCLAGCGKEEASRSGGPGAPTPVRTVAAATGEVEQIVRAVGQLRAVESVTLASEVAGIVSSLHFDEGATVSEGDLLVELDDSRARAELSAARAARDRAARQVERFEQAAQTAGASVIELDTVRTELEQAEAQFELARLRLEDHRISAPFGGRVGLRMVSPGAYVQAGDELTTLTMVSPIDIEFAVPEQHLTAMREGLTLTATSPAFEREFSATVRFISPRVEETTRALRVMGRADNPQGLLRPGMFANVRLVLGARQDAVLVPEAAVQYQGSQAMLYVVQESEGGEVARVRRVQVGQRSAGSVEIVEGVLPGERVVVEGLQRIRDGARVAAQRQAAAEEPAERGGG